MNDKISVIVPVYNIEKKIRIFRKSIHSVLQQTYPNLELILVNDGSTDKTSKIIKKEQKKDKRIRLISKENGGVESARRKGLQLAQGEFVIHMDQDDMLHKNALQSLYNQIIKADADVAVADSTRFVISKALRWGKPYWNETEVINQEEFMKNYYVGFFGISVFPVNIWNKLYRKSFLSRIPEPPLTGLYNEDLSYNLHVLPNASRIVLVAETLYYYRWGGFTNQKINKLLEAALSCYRIKMEQIQELQKKEYEHSTCVELLNYLNTYFYQLIEYDNVDKSKFVEIASNVLQIPECKHAIIVVKGSDKYHNAHVDYMLSNDIKGLERYEREMFVRNRRKRIMKKILSIMCK